MPPPAELWKRPQDGISWVQKVAAVEIGFFVVLLDVLGVYEEEVGRWSNEGPTRVEGTPRGVGTPPTSWPPH